MKKYKNILFRIFLLVVLIIVIGVLAYNLYSGINWITDKSENEKELAEINQEVSIEEILSGENVNPPTDTENEYWNYIKIPLMNVDISELQQINSDTIGFLSVSRNEHQLSCCSNHK